MATLLGIHLALGALIIITCVLTSEGAYFGFQKNIVKIA
jgi:hypothetical protein